MYKALPAVAVLALALAPASPMTLAGTAATPAPANATPPPTIIHLITRPLCSELHKHIQPAIAMMLENDQNIKKGPQLFSRYNRDALSGVDNSASNAAGPNGGVQMSNGGAADSTMTASQNMALLGMENLVSPIANNIIATQKMLDSPALMYGTGNPEDDKQLAAMRDKLLKALATQNAALDIISGFVATQQMGDLQHSGEEYIAAVNQGDITGKASGATPTPFPLTYNPNQAGLPQNPYDLDLANVPGLTLGYNPVTRLLDALHWTIDETTTRENDAATAVMASAQECSASAPRAATPKP
ncbi:MAG TPA: hypothetical protein VJP76_07475 [Candidatus Tumulicola sp.]|nr:hypothetical protein [Candidatus Tumulicola sp.]